MAREPKPEEVLSIEIDALALPSRVARAAQMFAEAVEALGGDAGKITMVVSNLKMVASVRGWEGVGADRVRAVTQLVENPLEAVQERPELRPVAAALATGARELASLGGRFRKNGRRITRLDDSFVRVMEAASIAPTTARRSVEGTTELYSSVIRVGRQRQGGPLEARIVIAGQFRDVDVAEGADAAFFDAAKDGGIYRVRVRATWVGTAEGALEIDPKTALATSADPWKPIRGAQAVRDLAAVISPETAESLFNYITQGDA